VCLIRVGMLLSLRGMWQGGVNYFHNLLQCYRQYPDPEVKLEVFTPFPEDVAAYQSDAIAIHSCPHLLPRFSNYPHRLIKRLLGYDPLLTRVMERHQIDLLTHSTLGRQTRISTLQWMPDFQHKKMPQFFSPEDCARRDSDIGNVRLWGNILLSSHAAEGDFRRYYPELAHVKTHILHFSSAEVLNTPILGRAELESRYPVREPYFFLPNQFWQHKNHGVVVEALHQSAPEIRVICTGPLEDRRDPTYVAGLMDKVKQAGLEGRFVCLGVVPYPVLVSLMHHSIAVVQPSLFEGWSTTVEESKTMRKQIILSNIDVHLEQAPERGVYFSPDSPQELAACLRRSFAEFDSAKEQSFAEQRARFKTTIERDWIEDFARILKIVSATQGQTIGSRQ
jgi:glycosyltransferase involved in cell wall biosynthesis